MRELPLASLPPDRRRFRGDRHDRERQGAEDPAARARAAGVRAFMSGNKQLAMEFFGRFSANDVAGALDCLTEDVQWWIAGKPGVTPTSGVNDKKRLARLFANMMGQLKDGMK